MTDLGVFAQRFAQCVWAIEEAASLFSGGTQALAEAEAEVELQLVRVQLERARLPEGARASLDELVVSQRDLLGRLRSLHDGLVRAGPPFLVLVRKLDEAACVARIQAATAGVVSKLAKLPTADELRELKDAMVALVRCFDSPPALPPAPVAPREGRPSVSHSPAGGGR